jgi:Ca2+-binding RTX toxin-like protein
LANVIGTADNDVLQGDLPGLPEVDTLSGLAGDDTLFGDGLADTLNGGEGNDVLNGGAGNDVMVGGTGADIFVAASRGQNETDLVVDFSIAEGDRIDLRHLGISEFATVQRLLSDLGADTALTLSGGLATQRLRLQGIDGPSLLSAAQFIFATLPGAAEIEGTGAGDHLFGGTGNQRLVGLSGPDTLFGEAGDDRLEGGDGVDGLFGGTGNDTLNGGAGNDTLVGGSGADLFVAPAARSFDTDVVIDFQIAEGDWIDLRHLGISEFATAQRLLVDLGASTELRIFGQGGVQRLVLQGVAEPGDLTAAQFLLTTRTGPEEVEGSAAADHLFGGLGDQHIFAGEGNDTVFGEAGNDRLEAGGGFDLLFGGGGDDTLIGGTSNDTFTGGAGADVFVAPLRGTGDTDLVLDFSLAPGRPDRSAPPRDQRLRDGAAAVAGRRIRHRSALCRRRGGPAADAAGDRHARGADGGAGAAQHGTGPRGDRGQRGCRAPVRWPGRSAHPGAFRRGYGLWRGWK